MTISTLQEYATATKQRLFYRKTGTVGVSFLFSPSKTSSTGSEPAFSAVANSANGIVPTGSDTGFPLLPPLPAASVITAAAVHATNTARLLFYDRLFHCGPYNTNNTSVTLTSQPSYSARVPGGTEYSDLMLFIESNSSSGTPVFTITYTDQSGNAGSSTSFTLANSFSGGNGFCQKVPLAAGDSGLSKIESITTSAVGSGTFNLVVARPLLFVCGQWTDQVDLPIEHLCTEIFQDTALAVLTSFGASESGSVSVEFEIASG